MQLVVSYALLVEHRPVPNVGKLVVSNIIYNMLFKILVCILAITASIKMILISNVKHVILYVPLVVTMILVLHARV